MDLPDGPGDGVRCEGTSVQSVCESFIKIWHQEPYQDFFCPWCLFLESRRTLLIDLVMVSYGRKYPTEATLDVSSRSDIRNRVKSPTVLWVSSWSLGGHGHSWWTWRTVYESFIKIWHQEPCQDSTPPPNLFLESKRTWIWRWCQMGGNIHPKCLWKFHQDLTSVTMSRLQLSSKSLPRI